MTVQLRCQCCGSVRLSGISDKKEFIGFGCKICGFATLGPITDSTRRSAMLYLFKIDVRTLAAALRRGVNIRKVTPEERGKENGKEFHFLNGELLENGVPVEGDLG